ncbi:hypothetical protein ALC62_15123, partial [Cyphomyrmex costatus]
TGFQLMGGQVDNEEYLRVSEIAEKRVEKLKSVRQNRDAPFADRRAHAGRSDAGAQNGGESKPGRVGREGVGLARPDPRAITFSFSACTVLEFMPDGELMRDRFVVITRRRRRRDGKSRKTSGLASLSPRERAAASETEKQGAEDGEGQR